MEASAAWRLSGMAYNLFIVVEFVLRRLRIIADGFLDVCGVLIVWGNPEEFGCRIALWRVVFCIGSPCELSHVGM